MSDQPNSNQNKQRQRRTNFKITNEMGFQFSIYFMKCICQISITVLRGKTPEEENSLSS